MSCKIRRCRITCPAKCGTPFRAGRRGLHRINFVQTMAANSAVSSTFRLLVRRDLQLVHDVRLSGDTVTVGRSARCDLQLDHEDVAPVHARLDRSPAGWTITDLAGGRGLRVNGQRVTTAPLEPGDVIDVRPFAMNFLTGRDDDSLSADMSLHLSGSEVVATLVRESQDTGFVIRQRLEDLYALSRLILARKDNGSFWQIIHAALQRCLAADRCVLVGVDARGGLFRLAPRARPTAGETPLGVSKSILRDTIKAGGGMLIERVAQDHRYADARSLIDHRSGSVICVPLVVNGATRVVMYADRELSRVPFQAADLDFSMAAMDLAATAVSMDELQAQMRELSRIRARIDVAREMQKMLLPSPIAQPDWGEVAALNHPADQMSGDIYDVLLDPAGRLVVSLADVSGKGVPAAFVTAILQSSLRQGLAMHDDLAAVLQGVNRALETSSPADCFATMLVLRFSPDGRAFELANAGHHPPLGWGADGVVEELRHAAAVPLGILPDYQVSISRHDAGGLRGIVLFSDGIVECQNAQKQDYGIDRLREVVSARLADDAARLASAIADDVRSFAAPAAPADDVTLAVIRRR